METGISLFFERIPITKKKWRIVKGVVMQYRQLRGSNQREAEHPVRHVGWQDPRGEAWS